MQLSHLIFHYKVNKKIFCYLLFMLLNYKVSYSQIYFKLMTKDGINQILSKGKSNKSTFAQYRYTLDTITEIIFSFRDTNFISESILVNNKIEGVENYYEKGSLTRSLTYKNGCLDGFIYEYFNTGQVRELGFYKCINIDTIKTDTIKNIDTNTGIETLMIQTQFSHSIKDGTWYFFNKNGKIKHKEHWRDNVMYKKDD